ncbi:DUF2272 domain-containing protein [Granulibacter bethesdensis]|uniref:Secreted protein n=1 Tax=Granulibacter bethesdensis (strain ATCC BAA-1260 / CGDNIH1) TaxID=391165 RepID=Q0BSA9_GRABC|nr:DUF2272 domain-containing protein [Granulibacter bethesdensis]ABI62293.1 putative secreted protein [Granulibacter bethesdensis CGDNIH1]APH52120.1 putative secreted protein [Granulibacter bethesdensis]APH64811.1 putative secreted protein [Granulibacter bethesdensis]
MRASVGAASVACLLMLTACSSSRSSSGGGAGSSATGAYTAANEAHIPDFARMHFAPFNRADAIGLASAEWRAFGSEVHDEPPGENPDMPPMLRPDRQPGLWEKVGLFWWLGQDADTTESLWSGAYTSTGTPLPDKDIHPWSAAFISYVMRIAGAGARFPYSASHSTYINIAKQMATGAQSGYAVIAERPGEYAPVPGDLICTGRGKAERLTYDSLPTGGFPSHCDIIVAARPGELSVIGGNVAYSVSMKHVPTTPSGMIATPDGQSVDPRYPWFVVLRVTYDQ